MLSETRLLTADQFERGTGWSIRPEGACQGSLCVPLPGDAYRGDKLDIDRIAPALGMAIVEAEGLVAIGPASFSGRALTTVEAPELVLPEFSGAEFRLSSLRGKKVVLVAWAPY